MGEHEEMYHEISYWQQTRDKFPFAEDGDPDTCGTQRIVPWNILLTIN